MPTDPSFTTDVALLSGGCLPEGTEQVVRTKTVKDRVFVLFERGAGRFGCSYWLGESKMIDHLIDLRNRETNIRMIKAV